MSKTKCYTFTNLLGNATDVPLDLFKPSKDLEGWLKEIGQLTGKAADARLKLSKRADKVADGSDPSKSRADAIGIHLDLEDASLRLTRLIGDVHAETISMVQKTLEDAGAKRKDLAVEKRSVVKGAKDLLLELYPGKRDRTQAAVELGKQRSVRQAQEDEAQARKIEAGLNMLLEHVSPEHGNRRLQTGNAIGGSVAAPDYLGNCRRFIEALTGAAM